MSINHEQLLLFMLQLINLGDSERSLQVSDEYGLLPQCRDIHVSAWVNKEPSCWRLALRETGIRQKRWQDRDGAKR